LNNEKNNDMFHLILEYLKNLEKKVNDLDTKVGRNQMEFLKEIEPIKLKLAYLMP
jgi:hypothetical protein